MRSLFIEEVIIPNLKKIGKEGMDLFGYSSKKKSQIHIDFLDRTHDFSSARASLKVFFDLIAGHHEALKEEEQECFFAISKKLDELPEIYYKLPDIDMEFEETKNVIQEFIRLTSSSFKLQYYNNLFEDVKSYPQMNKSITLLYYCVVLQELEEKVFEILDILSEFKKQKS